MIDDQPLTDGLHINAIGVKRWFLNNRLHREDGPAVEWLDGSKCWYLHGNRHREDGPAIDWISDARKEWYLNGIKLDCKTQEEFEHLMKLKAFW